MLLSGIWDHSWKIKLVIFWESTGWKRKTTEKPKHMENGFSPVLLALSRHQFLNISFSVIISHLQLGNAGQQKRDEVNCGFCLFFSDYIFLHFKVKALQHSDVHTWSWKQASRYRRAQTWGLQMEYQWHLLYNPHSHVLRCPRISTNEKQGSSLKISSWKTSLTVMPKLLYIPLSHKIYHNIFLIICFPFSSFSEPYLKKSVSFKSAQYFLSVPVTWNNYILLCNSVYIVMYSFSDILIHTSNSQYLALSGHSKTFCLSYCKKKK